MTDFFYFFVNMWQSVFALLSRVTFEFMGYQVNYLSLLIPLFIVGIFVTAFWKGSRT